MARGKRDHDGYQCRRCL